MPKKPFQLDAAKTSGSSPSPIPFDPADLITVEEVARRLRSDLTLEKGVHWVREKCRRRCQNPMPVRNLGRHLIFSWSDVSEWIRNSERPRHVAHPPRRKKKDKQVAEKAA